MGDTEVTLRVGNKPSSSLRRPVEAASSVRLSCARPHSVQLRPQIPGPATPGLPPCPLQARQGRLAAQSYLDLKIEVTLKDAADRVIDSVAGTRVAWGLSDPSLGEVAAADGVLQPGDSAAHQLLRVADRSGPLDITATIARDGGLLGAASHSDTAMILLVEDARLEPESLELFVLETGEAKSSQGSGYFTVAQEAEDVMTSSYSAARAAVQVTPVSTGRAALALVDLCLSARRQASLRVAVAGVHRVLLDTRDKVQLGDTIAATVRMVDSNMRPLPASSLHHVSLDIVTEQSDKVAVAAADSSQPATFAVTGSSLGQAVLVGRASYAGRVISSAPVPVTVYPGLEAEPRNISLVIGASFQFTAAGGPADCGVQWSVAEPGLATSSEEGVVTSLALGTTSLTARSVCGDGAVYSEDTVRVHIRPLSSLQLVVPSTSVGVATLLPVYLFGQDSDMNVYSYGSALPILNIDWSVSPGAGARLQSPLAAVGHSLVSDNSGVAVFTSSAPGKFSVTATVSISAKLGEAGQHQLDRDRSLTVTTVVTVTERLQITNLAAEARAAALLLAPGSSYQLRSN